MIEKFTNTLLQNSFRNDIDEEIQIVRKIERDNETYKFVCFLASVLIPAACNTKYIEYEMNWMFDVLEVLKVIFLREF